VSPLFIIAGVLIATFFWAENKGLKPGDSDGGGKNVDDEDNDNSNGKEVTPTKGSPTKSGWEVIFSDPTILLIGLVQSLFEGSMYIFVLVWPPALKNSIRMTYGDAAVIPFGTIFSCFMACCLMGSVMFGQLRRTLVDQKHILTGILFVSSVVFSWSAHAIQTGNLLSIMIAFFTFEACVGMYFPSIGTIRSELLPESHRCAIMTLFAVPQNILVVGVISFQSSIGETGSLAIASLAMGIATICMIILRWKVTEKNRRIQRKARVRWVMIKATVKLARTISMLEMERELNILQQSFNDSSHHNIGYL